MADSQIRSSPEICPHCGGSGWESITPSTNVRRCRCSQTARIDRLLSAARIPKRYEHCDLDSYDAIEQSQKRAKLNVRKFLDKYPLVEEGLIAFDIIPLVPYPGFSRLFAEET